MELQRDRHPAISGYAWVLWDYPWNTLHGRRYRSSGRGAGREGDFRSHRPWRPCMNVFFSATILFPYFLVLSIFKKSPICCCSVAQSCLTLCNPRDRSMPDFLSFTISQSLLSSCPMSRWCHPTISSCVTLFSCPQSFPASGFFPNESVLHIRWPKDWSFSFSIRPSSECLGLISFRMD